MQLSRDRNKNLLKKGDAFIFAVICLLYFTLFIYLIYFCFQETKISEFCPTLNNKSNAKNNKEIIS